MIADRIVLTLFTRQPLVEEIKARALYEILDQWRFRPSKFNEVEPIRNDWVNRDKFIQQFNANCQESFGTLLVKWTKPTFNLMVMWSKGPSAKSHCLSFFQAKHKDLGGAKIPYLFEIADQLFEQLAFDYGFACTDAEYHASNINLNVPIDERTVQMKQVVGMEWPDCIPGLYWCNYFGNEYFKQGFGRDLLKLDHVTQLTNGVRLLRSESALDWQTSAEQSAAKRLMSELGKEWFFTKQDGMPSTPLNTDKSLFAKPQQLNGSRSR